MPKASRETQQIEAVKPWMDLMQAKTFLAGDFLLWLWYFSESDRNPLTLQLPEGPTEVRIWVEDRLVLESHENKGQIHTFKGGDPSKSLEAEFALKSGKVVKELRLGFQIEPYGEFISVLGSKDLSPKSIYLPVVKGEGPNASLGLAFRLQMTDLYLAALDALFVRFLAIRANEAWREMELPSIRRWIQARGQEERALH